MEEIDLKRFAKTAYGKKWYIVIILIISVVLGYVYSFIYNTPKYKSSTTIVLAQVSTSTSDDINNSITQTDITMNKNLVDTYSEIIKSRKILTEVIDNLSLDVSVESLARMISVTSGTNTEILTVVVSNEDPVFAKDVTNEIAKVFSEKVVEIYNINNVYIIDEANLATRPYNINHPKDLVIFFMLGIFASFGLVALIYMLDTTIKQEEDIEENLELPVLGVIPMIDSKEKDKEKEEKNTSNKKNKKNKKKESKVLEDIDMPTTESFRTLRTNLTFAQKNNQIKNILITSSFMSEGKSYIASNLAIALARSNQKVLIIDGDMRKGRQHQIFRVDNAKGLANCLSDLKTLNIENVSKYIKTTKVPNLHIITSGDRPTNPSELISSRKMLDLLSIVNDIYDIVIIDGTPSILVADSIALAKFVKNIIIVTAYKSTKIESVKKVKKVLENVNASITGVVLNKFPIDESNYGYYYSDEDAGASRMGHGEKERIKSVREVIDEARFNKKISEFESNNERSDSIENLVTIENHVPVQEFQATNNSLMEYKIENISNEINTIKNLFIQYMMNNKSATKEEIDDMRKEIVYMRETLEQIQTDNLSKEIKEEIESVKSVTSALLEQQQANNEKVKKFIEDYKNRRK